MARKIIPLEDRFWPKVKKAGPDECWEWQGACIGGGYGVIGVGGHDKGQVGAHRVAWMLTYGPIPKGIFVLHTCDNPPCVNVAHLFLGSKSDNSRDAVAKGRWANKAGEKNPAARLNERQVLKMRDEHASGCFSLAELGRRFGVTRGMAWLIVRRKNWKHI